MIFDYRGSNLPANIDADVVIVGAGPAGIVLALEIAKSNIKVAILESGGGDYEPDAQSLNRGTKSGIPYFPLDSSRFRGLGGSTGYWSGWCGPMNEIDFIERDWIPNSGWPISRDDLDSDYIAAHEYLRLGRYGYSIPDWEEDYKEFPQFESDVLLARLWQISSPPLNFGKAYFQELSRSERIDVYTHVNVTNINSNDDGSYVESLEIQSFTGKKGLAVAKNYVLACGGIENPRLLLSSNDVVPSGLGNENDLVGRYFMEHVEVESAKLFEFNAELMRKMKRYVSSTGEVLSVALCNSPSKQKELKVGNGGAFLAAPSVHSDQNGWKSFLEIRDGLLGGKVPNDFLTHFARFFKDFDTAAAVLALRLRNIDTRPEIVQRGHIDIISMCEQIPNPDSRISLSSETDSLGNPAAHLHWSLTELDRQTIKQTMLLIGAEFGRTGLARLKINDWLLDDNAQIDWPSRTRGGNHHMGTTRMSDNPVAGVVDKNLKVHGVSNLFVAGSSVFPTGGFVNPTMTIVALSIRLGKFLVDENKV